MRFCHHLRSSHFCARLSDFLIAFVEQNTMSNNPARRRQRRGCKEAPLTSSRRFLQSAASNFTGIQLVQSGHRVSPIQGFDLFSFSFVLLLFSPFILKLRHGKFSRWGKLQWKPLFLSHTRGVWSLRTLSSPWASWRVNPVRLPVFFSLSSCGSRQDGCHWRDKEGRLYRSGDPAGEIQEWCRQDKEWSQEGIGNHRSVLSFIFLHWLKSFF